MGRLRELLWFYVGVGCATLVFQIWVRWDHCAGAAACGLSFGKGLVWSTIHVHFSPVLQPVWVSGLQVARASTPLSMIVTGLLLPHATRNPTHKAPVASFCICQTPFISSRERRAKRSCNVSMLPGGGKVIQSAVGRQPSWF